jgi:hypothetical protein
MHSSKIIPAIAWLTLAACWSGCTQAPAPEAKIHRMGERVDVGSLVYNVFDTQWKPQLGEGTDARVPKDRFFLVHLSVVNSGSSDAIVPTITLMDDSGETYTELSDGDQVPMWAGFLRRVKPAETLQGNLIFDVPPKHYRIRLSDENDQKNQEVDIPLSFVSESPDIPAPVQ